MYTSAILQLLPYRRTQTPPPPDPSQRYPTDPKRPTQFVLTFSCSRVYCNYIVDAHHSIGSPRLSMVYPGVILRAGCFYFERLLSKQARSSGELENSRRACFMSMRADPPTTLMPHETSCHSCFRFNICASNVYCILVYIPSSCARYCHRQRLS